MSWNIAKPGDQINGPVAVTGNLNVDSNTLFVDSATNRVGVLTASPTVPLDVVGDAKVSGNLTVDTNTLVVDAANNRLGIGTATPSVALDVNGSAYFRASSAILGAGTPFEWISTYPNRTQAYQSSGNDFEINNISSGGFRLYLNSTERLRIASDGVCTWSNVVNAGTAMTLNGTGLGVGTSPSYKLDVSGAGNFQQLRVYNPSAANIAIVNTTSALTYTLFSANTAANGFNGFGIFDGTAYRLAIDSSGNVGIGTTSPVSRLHVDKNSAAVNYVSVGNITNGIQVGVKADGTPVIQNYGGVGMVFGGNGSTTPSTQMTLDASGNLLVGTASVLNLGKVSVYQSGNGQCYVAKVSNNGYSNFQGFNSSDVATFYATGDGDVTLGSISRYGSAALPINVNGAERLRIKSTGQVNFVGLASDPAGAAAGDVYYNTTTNKLKCYNGTTWNDLF